MCFDGKENPGGYQRGAIGVVQDRGRYFGVEHSQDYVRGKRERILVAPKLSLNLDRLDSLDASPRRLKLLLLKAILVDRKTTAIQDLILDEQAGPACITQTWLDEAGGVNLTQLCPLGFLCS